MTGATTHPLNLQKTRHVAAAAAAVVGEHDSKAALAAVQGAASGR
jgi:hypothetical protein